jgi:hypothetical protein
MAIGASQLDQLEYTVIGFAMGLLRFDLGRNSFSYFQAILDKLICTIFLPVRKRNPGYNPLGLTFDASIVAVFFTLTCLHAKSQTSTCKFTGRKVQLPPPGGEIIGFVLQNSLIALTPPMGTNDLAVAKRGSAIAVSGFAHSTAGGKTVLEMQPITANGQTIAMNVALRGRPDRERRTGARERTPRRCAASA